MKFCCDMMWSSVGEAGYKGFSVIIRNLSYFCPETNENINMYRFMIQYRSHDLDKYEGKVYFGEMALLYCPACGANLITFIENNKDIIMKLAEEHKHLVLD